MSPLRLAAALHPGNGVLAARSLANIASNEQEVSHTQSVLTELALVSKTVDEAETGQRGYILTNQSSYLKPYMQALVLLPDILSRLQTLMVNEHEQQQRLHSLRTVIADKESEMAQTVTLQRQGQTSTALSIVLTGAGQQKMDAIRTVLGDMEASEEVSLDQQQTRVSSSLEEAAGTLAAATLASIALLFGIFLMLIRWMQDRERHLAEEQLARQKAEAAVTLRDQFLSIASHELKTPITALMATTQILERRLAQEGALNDRSRKSLATVDHQVTRLVRLLDTMLDVTRIDHGQLMLSYDSVDLVALAQEVVEDLQQTSTGHFLQVASTQPTLNIEADPLRLEQVIRNLVQNAIKYSPDDTDVQLGLGVELPRDPAELEELEELEETPLPGEEPEIQVGPVRPVVSVPTAVLTVKDSGIGIPREAQARLFERFYRAPNAGTGHVTGLGIGLHVSQEIVRLHGGDISVESDEGSGSTFTVRLPIERRETDDCAAEGALQE